MQPMVDRFFIELMVLRKSTLFLSLASFVFLWLMQALPCLAENLPNVVLILADDLGYGDLRCYHAASKIATPHVDRLAAEGMRWTDAHSPSTVCTPTRYGLMTGQMPFRIAQGGKVFTGVEGPSLIAKDRLTLPEMLLQKGYATAAVGKWHLGWTFRDTGGNAVTTPGVDGVRSVDYTRRIEGGPLDHGFEQFFGTACCPTTDWLYAFIVGDRIPVPPTGPLPREALPKNPYTEDCRHGWIAPDFDMQEVDQRFLEQSLHFIRQHVRTAPRKPFFLFHATQAVHLPSFPGKDFRGKTQTGPHGDFIAQWDAIVGTLMQELEQQGIADDTVVLLTSDNGPEVAAVVQMRADHGHDGAKPWRGVKRDAWEGGHRVPFIVRWPAHIKSGTTCDHLASLTDVMATLADIIDFPLPRDAAEDSFSLWPAMAGKAVAPARPYLLTQAFRGAATLSLRRGNWKLINHTGSGGNRYDQGPLQRYAIAENDPNAIAQLYDLATDPAETNNRFSQRADVAAELQQLLIKTIKDGRSRP